MMRRRKGRMVMAMVIQLMITTITKAMTIDPS